MLINSYAFFLHINAPWFFKGKEKVIAEYLKRRKFIDNTELDMFCRKIVGVLKGVNIDNATDYLDFAKFIETAPGSKATLSELLQLAISELEKKTDRGKCEIKNLLIKGIPPLAIINYKKHIEIKTEFDANLYAKSLYGGIEPLCEKELIEILQSELTVVVEGKK